MSNKLSNIPFEAIKTGHSIIRSDGVKGKVQEVMTYQNGFVFAFPEGTLIRAHDACDDYYSIQDYEIGFLLTHQLLDRLIAHHGVEKAADEFIHFAKMEMNLYIEALEEKLYRHKVIHDQEANRTS